MLYTASYSSPLGQLQLAGEAECLTGLWLEGQKYQGELRSGHPRPLDDLPAFHAARQWLDDYFAGRRPSPARLSLAPHGSPFRQLVWRLLLEIPYGQTTTYGAMAREIAKRMGKTAMASQAVGGAVAHNPISIIIPCHRVIGAGGALTGYAGGLERKAWLLRHETGG